jgi:hypothetical protein
MAARLCNPLLSDRKHKRVETAMNLPTLPREEGPHLPAADNQPDRARLRIFGIVHGRQRFPGGMRMIMADDLGTAKPLRAVRGEQRYRVDFEIAPTIRRHIWRGNHLFDPVSLSEEKAAHLLRRGLRRMRQDLIE